MGKTRGSVVFLLWEQQFPVHWGGQEVMESFIKSYEVQIWNQAGLPLKPFHKEVNLAE